MLPRLLLSEADALPQPLLRVRVRRLLREADAMSVPAAVVRTDGSMPEVGALPAVCAAAAAGTVRGAVDEREIALDSLLGS